MSPLSIVLYLKGALGKGIPKMMKNLLAASILFALAMMAGCGGGSSSSSVPENNPPAVDDNEPSQPSDEGNPNDSGETVDLDIHFPRNASVTSQSTLTLRGSVDRLPEGYQVLVNGEPVERDRVAMGAKGGVSEFRRAPQNGTLHERSVTTQSDVIIPQSDYEWKYVANLIADGIIEFTVEVVDADGNPVVPETVHYVERRSVPWNFGFDPVNRRLAGMEELDVVDISLATDEQSRYESVMAYLPVDYCHNRSLDEFIYISLVYEEEDLTPQYAFRRFPLSSDALPSLLHIQPVPGDGVQEVDLLCDSEHLYLAVNHEVFSDNGKPYSAVYSLTLSEEPEWKTLYQGQPWSEGGQAFSSVVLAGGDLLVYSERDGGNYEQDGVYRLALDSGELFRVVEGYQQSLAMLAQGSDLNEIYAVSFSGVDVIDPRTNERHRISDSKENHEHLDFSQYVSAALDESENRLLVGDSDLDMVLSVDLETGERSVVLSRGRGEGARIIQPSDALFDEREQVAYVLDGGSNTNEKLLRVDLESGDRAVLATLSSDGFNAPTGGMARDLEQRVLYAVSGNALYKIDESDGKTTMLTAEEELGNLQGVAFDAEAGYLFLTSPLYPESSDSPGGGALISVDVFSPDYSATIVSKANERGDGAGLHTVNAVVLSPDGTIAYVMDQYLGTVFEVDLETGDREEMNIGCSDRAVGSNESFQGMALGENGESLLLIWDGITVVDRETGECLDHINDMDALDVVPGPGGSLFTVEQGGIFHLDPESMDKVTVSK